MVVFDEHEIVAPGIDHLLTKIALAEHPVKFKTNDVGFSHYFKISSPTSPDSVIILIQGS